ncbi:MAG: PAS domain S-box protein [Elusimicrobia bacterium]|nr:PAS domain S-box protein [Elusimicrobiota bacterium]
MADTPLPIETLSIEAVRAIGKTLGQMNLYRVGHPAVTASLGDALGHLTRLLDQMPEGELAYGIDQDKLIANGRIVGGLSQVPNSFLSLFNRYRLNSVTFKSGLTLAELTALCELAALRPEHAKSTDPKAFLNERDVNHIAFNEAIYAKVDKAQDAPPPMETAQQAFQAATASERSILQEIERQSLERSLEMLVQAAVPDPAERTEVYQAVLGQMQADLERRVSQATETVRKEKTRIENEQVRTQAVLSNMAEGVVVVDDDGKVLMMNPAAETLYGVRLAEVAGKSLAEHVKEEHLMTMATQIAAPPSDRPLEPEVSVTSTEDTHRTIRGSTALVQNEAGKTVGMVSVLTDVTKQRELQRTEREFVAHVTHELRAPLSSIRAAVELLQGQFSGKLENDDRKMFDTVIKNTDRLDLLIKGILDFSKIESGQMTVHPQACEVEKIAREGADSLRPWCLKKGIQLSLEGASGLPPVAADAPRTVQVLVNLLSNAIKFTPSGGRITVRVAGGTGRQERFAVFSVQDTGPGIAKQDQEKIFEKFVQIASGERHVGGTGLGLAIAKALIHLQRGQMWVQSEAGQGATFLFTLPYYVASKETTQPAPKPPSARAWWKRLFGAR